MYALAVLQALIAVSLCATGYQIFFRGEYYLVRGYVKGRERYARRTGVLRLTLAALDLAALPLLVLCGRTGDLAFVIPVIGGALLLWAHRKLSKK